MTGEPRNLPSLALSRSALDRAGWRRHEPDLLTALTDDPGTRLIELRGDHLQARGDASALVRHRPAELPLDPRDQVIFLGEGGLGESYLGVLRAATEDEDRPDRSEGWQGLRTLGLTLGPLDVALAATLVGMAHWHRGHGFCARCGQATEVVQAGWVRRCPEGHDSFPTTSPAVIMAVTDEQDRLLLARNSSWPEGRLSVLAGFVEPGEALEVAVAREVAEEVGVPVTDVRYAGNQPWPFPASLMLAFTARATSTDLVLADGEIAEARWFTREELAAEVGAGTLLSGGTAVSVAYHLIESWLGSPIASHRPSGAAGAGG